MKYSDWVKLQAVHCNKNRHRFRTNKFGITWCIICGALGNYNVSSQDLKENDKLLIEND